MYAPPRVRLLYVVTHPVSADTLLRGQLAFMREAGFDVTVIASPGEELERVAERERVKTMAVRMARPIRPKEDAASLARLTVAMRAVRPDIVNASTPKAGLLGMLAARALQIPLRIYLLRGLRLETTTGVQRRILATTERIASACAHHVVCNSESLRAAAVDGGYVSANKARIVGGGSSNGVEVDRWQRTAERAVRGREIAREHGIADDEEVITFVGRFDPDKGIVDLLEAFAALRTKRPKARLLLVGGGHAGDLDAEIVRRVARAPAVVSIGTSHELAPIYARTSVLAFPSYREGFPNVPLEAAAAEVPAVGYRSTGVVDAIEDGRSGVIVAQRDVRALGDALLHYLEDDELRRRHGAAARARAVMRFSREAVWRAWADFYRDASATSASRSGGVSSG